MILLKWRWHPVPSVKPSSFLLWLIQWDILSSLLKVKYFYWPLMLYASIIRSSFYCIPWITAFRGQMQSRIDAILPSTWLIRCTIYFLSLKMSNLFCLKGKFTLKWKLSHNLLNLVLFNVACCSSFFKPQKEKS